MSNRDLFCRTRKCRIPKTKIKFTNTNFMGVIPKYFNKLGKINLKEYAKVVIEYYRQDIKRAYKTLGINSKQLRLGGDFSFKQSDFEDTDKFDEIVNSREKYLWYGLVYEITEILSNNTEGKTIGGFTTSSMRNRWKNYVFKAVFQQGKGGKLHKLIYDYLYQVGFENLKIYRKYN